ncbi:hypothetical protein [Ardenticatena maritima]|nr:hypothetical protein [Ardenticatena maritima]
MKNPFSPKLLVTVNLILGLFLWFLYSTDYSLAGTIPDILLPPAIGIIAIISLAVSRTSSKRQQLLATLSYLPSIIGGGLYVLTVFLMLIPPFTLGTFFAASEIAGETEIQRAISPDRTRTAYVYFRGVGAYSGGNGRIFVRIRYQVLPFLERDIFYLPRSYASEDTEDYVEWRGNNALYISETQEEISVGIIATETPQVIALPYYIFRVLLTIAEQARVNQQQTIPVRDVPIYPGTIFSDQSQYLEREGTVFRSFNIEREDIEQVVKWYEGVFSTPPWTLVKIDRYTETESGLMHIRYCIQARRELENERRIYYWEFMGSNDPSRGVHVNIGSPNPITDTCGRYVEAP